MSAVLNTLKRGGPPTLSAAQWLERLRGRTQRGESPGMFAFYSSVVDAITTEPELFSVPIDDHAICRGHAVFDTCSLKNGRLYRLGVHLERLLDSAEAARISLPHSDTRAQAKERITDLVSATCAAGEMRMPPGGVVDG